MSSRSPLFVRDGQLRPFLVTNILVQSSLVFTYFAVKTPWGPWPRPIIAVAGLAASAALCWRRQTPLLLTLLGAVAFVVGSNPVALWAGVYIVALGGPRRPRWAVAVAGLGSFSATLLWAESLDLEMFIVAAGVVGVVIGLGSWAGAREEVLRSSRERAERVERERRQRDEQARAGERNRIAQEMHDVLGHKMTLIAIQAGALEVTASAGPERVEQAAQLIRVTAREALEELRGVLGLLRDQPGADPGLPDQFPDLHRLVDRSVASGVQVELRDEIGTLPVVTARAAYRVVQEGLTNAHKHAPGAGATVEVAGEPGQAVTVVVANGAPVDKGDVLPGAGLGLIGLSERVRLLGGQLEAGPDAFGGWRLEATIPWLDAAADNRTPVAAGVGASAPEGVTS